MCKMTPIGVRLNLKNFLLISFAVLELLRKVSQGGGSVPPREIGLKYRRKCISRNSKGPLKVAKSKYFAKQIIYSFSPDCKILNDV